LKDGYRDGCTLHWWPEVREDAASVYQVSVIDAVIHAVRCQPAELGIALLDSALHENVIYPRQLDAIFAALPRKYRRLRRQIDSRCMSGIETIIRLELTALRIPFELQVVFTGVGTVDFVVDGRIIIETDGRKWHEGLEPEKRDYDRDIRLAALGYQVLRFNYRQVMFHRAEVIAAIQAALAAHLGPAAMA
jgi:very-short-patch-repair endonuclease